MGQRFTKEEEREKGFQLEPGEAAGGGGGGGGGGEAPRELLPEHGICPYVIIRSAWPESVLDHFLDTNITFLNISHA